jgi:hypothetical protein
MLTCPEILDQLRYNRGMYPADAVSAALEQRAALTPPLLQALEELADNPARALVDGHVLLPYFALALLARWREPRALPPLLRFLDRLTPGDEAFFLDFLDFTGLAQIIASVTGDDLAPLRPRLIDRRCALWVRSACLEAHLHSFVENRLARAELVALLRSLFHDLEREPSPFWDLLAEISLFVAPGDLRRELLDAVGAELVSASQLTRQDALAIAPTQAGRDLQALAEDFPGFVGRIEDLLEVSICFWRDRADDGPDDDELDPDDLGEADDDDDDEWDNDGEADEDDGDLPPALPLTRLAPKIGRNAPCPCGSGKKYKNCCGGGT